MAYISEIHYQNAYAATSGETEFIEVVLTAAEFANAADYSISTYQADGSVENSISLDQLTPIFHSDENLYTYSYEAPVTNPDHSPGGDTSAGEAEGVSLVNTDTNEVIDFYDIGIGTTAITATDGPAAGATSEHIDGSATGESIQFDSHGTRFDGDISSDAAPLVTMQLTGDQIGTFLTGVSSGNGDDLILTIDGAQSLGTASDTYTIVVTQVSGFDYFHNGQFLTLLDSDGNVIFENAGVNNDEFQGRAAGDPYLVLENGYIIDLRGLPATPGSILYTIDDDVIGPPYLEPYGELNFDDVVGPMPCFVSGTHIDTQSGPKPVQDLKVGDLVLTKDNGYQPVLWIGQKQIQFHGKSDKPHLRPLRIDQRVLASHLSLVLSPQHRILVYGGDVAMVSGVDEALVSAEHLFKSGAAHRQWHLSNVTYFHIMFEQHELILSNGSWSESLDPYFLYRHSSTPAYKRENQALFAGTLPIVNKPSACVRQVLRSFEVQAIFAQSCVT